MTTTDFELPKKVKSDLLVFRGSEKLRQDTFKSLSRVSFRSLVNPSIWPSVKEILAAFERNKTFQSDFSKRCQAIAYDSSFVGATDR